MEFFKEIHILSVSEKVTGEKSNPCRGYGRAWSGGVVEWWSGGVVEWWSGGVVGEKEDSYTSNTPTLHYSNTPSF